MAVSDPTGARLPRPEIPVTITVWLQGREFQTQSLPAEFIWAIPDVSGLYKVWADFDVPEAFASVRLARFSRSRGIPVRVPSRAAV